MDVIAAVRFYIDKIISDISLDGMKALLMDAETTKVVSMVFSQSQILEKEVFLVESLGAKHERMNHLKAAVFMRPTMENIDALKDHLSDPKFGEYHIFFTNIIPTAVLQRLAEADEFEVIRQVHEYYADYLAINSDLFHLDIRDGLQLSSKHTRVLTEHAGIFNRAIEGILSVLLSLKKKPVIRYDSRSDTVSQLAAELNSQMQRDGLFDFRRVDVPPVLLILDRRDDPVTPLLSQWSYQAMVHELIGLDDNRVDLNKAPGVNKDLHQLVLSMTSDEFFAKHMYSNFGDLGMAVKELVDKYQQRAQTHEQIQSIEDMQKFIENYPAFRTQSLNVSKHVALMGELARLVEVQKLMDVSQFEQELACTDDHTSHYRDLVSKLRSSEILASSKIRLALLYALRYETNSNNQIASVKSILADQGIALETIRIIDYILDYGGTNVRSGDLYGDRGLKKYMKVVTQGLQLQGIQNVYSQHIPPLMKTVDLLMKGQLPEASFICLGGTGKEKPRDVIIFMLGGVTFEEATKVAEYNQKNTSTKIILGGTSILNSSAFIKELQNTFKNQSLASLSQRAAASWSYDGKKL